MKSAKLEYFWITSRKNLCDLQATQIYTRRNINLTLKGIRLYDIKKVY